MTGVLKCNKTQLYSLAAEYLQEAPPPLRRCEFIKACRDRAYWLKWSLDGYNTEIFLSVCCGRCIAEIRLTRTNDEGTRQLINRRTPTIPLAVLEARGMVEE